jgi:RimJ/RimL family protein N-acetyltransferase
MNLEFLVVDVPKDREQLADFLSSHTWPFHSRSQISRADIFLDIDKGEYSRADTQRFWIIRNAQPIGLIKLFDLDDIEDGSPLFDLRIHPDQQGQGVGKKAVKWLSGYLFNSYPILGRIEGTTRVDNIAMQKVFVACNFVKEGQIRKSWPAKDSKMDTVIYGLLREDWENNSITPIDWTIL